MDIIFENPTERQGWRAVNDGVMGGKSLGGPRFENDHMLFEGVINTNGGGFSSIRKDITPGSLKDASGLKLRTKPDGRNYKLTFRTDARHRGRLISFQGAIPQSKAGQWSDVTVSFDDLTASLFGQPVKGKAFDNAAVQEIGIIIADGQDGPFRLEVDWIKACEFT